MKLFVCADIEGCCGITDWSETQPGSPQSEAFRKQMTEEVAAVCRGALEAGFDRVVVRDAHDSARNLLPELLPEQTRIYRGWTGDPYGMLSGLDGSFAGVVFTGFHSPARTGGSPLAHTMDTGLYEVRLNGRIASEFLLNAYAAARIGVPVLMLTGDYGICFDAEKELPTLRLPDSFMLEASYKAHPRAYRNSFYPGAFLRDANTVVFESDDFYEILRFMHFCL